MNPLSKTILFLCTGNYYRSRFAEIYLNHQLGDDAGWVATSRGLAIEFGWNNRGPMSCYTLARLQTLGIAVTRYLRPPLQVTETDLEAAHLVIALKEAEHRPLLRKRHPDWEQRVEYWHVDDLDFAPPEVALSEIERQVQALAQRLGDLQQRVAG
jgi:protein-tyrosine phosphatase